MKSILYVGIIAMAGASIYGFVDYRKTVNSKAFNAMYVETAATEPEVIDIKEPATKTITEPVEIKKEVTTSTVKAKASVKRKKEKKDMFSKKRKNERKVDYRLFSRAPLKEYEEITPVEKEKVSQQ